MKKVARAVMRAVANLCIGGAAGYCIRNEAMFPTVLILVAFVAYCIYDMMIE